MMYRSDDVLLKSFVRRHITIYRIFSLVNGLLILHHDPHLANYFTIFHLYWCWYSFHGKSIPRCQTHQNQRLCLKRMLLFISIFPVLLGYLDGGPNFCRYGLSWSGSTAPYWSSFGWAQLWLALYWRLGKSPNHFVLTSAFVTQCWRWLWQRDEWGIKTHSNRKIWTTTALKNLNWHYYACVNKFFKVTLFTMFFDMVVFFILPKLH